MKTIWGLLLLVSMSLSSFAATVYPASTNGNNVFTGTNTFATLVGGNGAALTNEPIAALDNYAYSRLMSGSWGSFSNVNRFAWKNTINRLASGTNITVMVTGDGIADIFAAYIYERWRNFGIPNAGLGDGTYYTWIMSTNGDGALLITNKDSHSLKRRKVNIRAPGQTAIATPTGPTTKWTRAGVVHMGTGGFDIYTNGVLAVSGVTSSPSVSHINWITNSPSTIPIFSTVSAVGGASASDVWILDMIMIDDTVRGGIIQLYDCNAGGVNWSDLNAPPSPARNWYREAGIDLIVARMFDSNYNDPETYNYISWVKTNLTSTDLILLGGYPRLPAQEAAEIVGIAKIQKCALTNGVSYFDAHSAFQSETNMLRRGWTTNGWDGAHIVASGFYQYADMFLDWVSPGRVWSKQPIGMTTNLTFQDLATNTWYLNFIDGHLMSVTNPTVASWTPLQVTNAVMQLWWDMYVTNPASGVGSGLNVFYDMSGSGHTGYALTPWSSNTPPYWTNNGAVIGGKPFAHFGLSCIQTNFAVGVAQTNTLFLVASLGDGVYVPARTSAIIDTVAPESAFYCRAVGGYPLELYSGSFVTGSQWAADPNRNRFMVFEICFTGGAGSYLHTNNVDYVTGNPGAVSMKGLALGSSNGGTSLWRTMDFAELLWFSGAPVSASDRANIYNYLNAKYSLP